MSAPEQKMKAEIIWACMDDNYYKEEAVLEHHCIVRLISGEMKIVQADDSYIIEAGETFLFPRRQLATMIKYPKDGRPYRAIMLILKAERLKDYYIRHPFNVAKAGSHKIKKYAKEPLLDSFFASLLPYLQMEGQLPESMISLKLEEAITILRAIDPDSDRVLSNFDEPGKIDLAEFMEKNYMFNITLNQFSYLTARSLSTFKRDFKKSFHSTPQKWLTQKRLELAHYQLAEKNKKPIEIYDEIGFEDLSHFSYAFKKHFGYAPSELIRRKVHTDSKEE
ncbi:helix-turn-helix domain-containing protein [Paenibacillus glycinis]|uniref:Helix-turn-helix domain-containing protein n=1 Tax=Paenibacillus glycinis TaxID=2697035 RepID=A0ABW9XMC1_9BACL|nr:AraC family transcriptional regulator [Paenibacillus glycinis]NBD23754.1 helix-turn-helix domain-containing protein [Paenibacillus glycinis]